MTKVIEYSDMDCPGCKNKIKHVVEPGHISVFCPYCRERINI